MSSSKLEKCTYEGCPSLLHSSCKEKVCALHKCETCDAPFTSESKIISCIRCAKSFHFDYEKLYRDHHNIPHPLEEDQGV